MVSSLLLLPNHLRRPKGGVQLIWHAHRIVVAVLVVVAVIDDVAVGAIDTC